MGKSTETKAKENSEQKLRAIDKHKANKVHKNPDSWRNSSQFFSKIKPVVDLEKLLNDTHLVNIVDNRPN